MITELASSSSALPIPLPSSRIAVSIRLDTMSGAKGSDTESFWGLNPYSLHRGLAGSSRIARGRACAAARCCPTPVADADGRSESSAGARWRRRESSIDALAAVIGRASGPDAVTSHLPQRFEPVAVLLSRRLLVLKNGHLNAMSAQFWSQDKLFPAACDFGGHWKAPVL